MTQWIQLQPFFAFFVLLFFGSAIVLAFSVYFFVLFMRERDK